MNDEYYELAKELGLIDDDDTKYQRNECCNGSDYNQDYAAIQHYRELIVMLVEELATKQTALVESQRRIQGLNNQISDLQDYCWRRDDENSMLKHIIDKLKEAK